MDARRARDRFVVGKGVVMLALGAFIGARPFWAGPHPLTGQRWLDVAFAVFFLLRGWMDVRAATGRPIGGPPPS